MLSESPTKLRAAAAPSQGLTLLGILDTELESNGDL